MGGVTNIARLSVINYAESTLADEFLSMHFIPGLDRASAHPLYFSAIAALKPVRPVSDPPRQHSRRKRGGNGPPERQGHIGNDAQQGEGHPEYFLLHGQGSLADCAAPRRRHPRSFSREALPARPRRQRPWRLRRTLHSAGPSETLALVGRTPWVPTNRLPSRHSGNTMRASTTRGARVLQPSSRPELLNPPGAKKTRGAEGPG